MSRASCLYEGSIRHRRYAVRRGEFTHRIVLAYVDLDELPELLGGRLVRRYPGLLRFRRRDYLGDPGVPVADAVRAEVRAAAGRPADGPIRVLTQLRSFGHCFNPVSFYYCFDASGERLQAVVAEVTNTPWGERHRYTIRLDTAHEADPGRGSNGNGVVRGEFDKAMHVSPFMGMDHRYVCRLAAPGESLSVHIESLARAATGNGEAVAFDATLRLRRRALSRRTAAELVLRYPAATLRVLALIYGHAALLWLRRIPVHPHPAQVSA